MPRERVEDLFDVFDPWTVRDVGGTTGLAEPSPQAGAHGVPEPGTVLPAPPSMTRSRRRIGPRIPPPAPPPAHDPSREPAAFLRTAGVEEVLRLARRLSRTQHRIHVQDLLDLPDAALRVLLLPQPGPMHVGEPPLRATFETLVPSGDHARVRAHYWIGTEPAERVLLGETDAEQLGTSWLNARLLDFVEAVLGD